MIKKIFLLLIIVSLYSCKSNVQVFQTRSNNVEMINETYVYENDTLEIIYNFWGDKGIMGFQIYNKLDVPLYIDWRKSSYIDNSVKLNYWEDVEHTSSVYAAYYFENKNNRTKGSAGAAASTTRKQERITFIPPKSKYKRNQFFILPNSFASIQKSATYTEETLRKGSSKTTKIYYIEFTDETTPLVFRNFLTFSLSENFETEFYVNNEFYISKVLELDENSFFQRSGYGNSPRYTKQPDDNENFLYRDRRSFFVRMAK